MIAADQGPSGSEGARVRAPGGAYRARAINKRLRSAKTTAFRRQRLFPHPALAAGCASQREPRAGNLAVQASERHTQLHPLRFWLAEIFNCAPPASPLPIWYHYRQRRRRRRRRRRKPVSQVARAPGSPAHCQSARGPLGLILSSLLLTARRPCL